MISFSHVFFYFYGVCAGAILGMDWGLLILTIFNPPKPNNIIIATQLGQSICLIALFLGTFFGILLGPMAAMIMVEIIDSFSIPFQICLYCGVITGFGTPSMIQSYTIFSFLYYLIRRIWNKENCNHIAKCECETINRASNDLIQDVFHYNTNSQFWNPFTIIQMTLAGNTLGLIIGGIYQMFQ